MSYPKTKEVRGLVSRREVLRGAAAAPIALAGSGAFGTATASQGPGIRYGMVTYQWGKDWELPRLLENCQAAGIHGVELRTTHSHGVEPTLTGWQRREVRKRFQDSPVELVGLGSNERFDQTDPVPLHLAIEASKRFIVLSHDVGSSGVKVKPNDLHEGVPYEKTIAQIGEALNHLGAFAASYGQQVRLEVHGQCARLPIMRDIMEIAAHPSVAVCWNSNKQDLEAPGLAHNFGLVKERLGATCHIHRLEKQDYPYPELFELLVGARYSGWLLLEDSELPSHPVPALKHQKALFEERLKAAQKG